MALKTFKFATYVSFTFESEKKDKPELNNKMIDISIFNLGTIGARICSSIHDKMEEILETRDQQLDLDPDNYNLPIHMSFSLYVGDISFKVVEVWRIKEKVSGVNGKWVDSYSHQGILDYRTSRQDIFYLLSALEFPYYIVLNAVLFKPK
jgi:hypothetical protein